MSEGVMVPLLADRPTEELKLEMERAAALIAAAKEDRLALVVCQDLNENEVLVLASGNDHTLVPLAELYATTNLSWMELVPPEAAVGSEDDNAEEEDEAEEEDGASETA